MYRPPTPSAALLIVHGKSESFTKYFELAADLQDLNLAIYMLDLRGFGFSDRLTDDPDKIHVARFADYTSDLAAFIRTVIHPSAPQQLFAIGHSLGALVVLDYLQHYPERIDGAILCAPLLRLRLQPVPTWLVRTWCRVALICGRAEAYAPGQRDYCAPPFAENPVTGSRARYLFYEQELKTRYPALRAGGVTYGWLSEILRAASAIAGRTKTALPPVLILQAAQDTIVDNQAITRFCRRTSGCRLQRIEDARHEILQEQDRVRMVALQAIRNFITAQQQTPVANRQNN